MIRVSWSTFRDRWQLFIGAIVAVAVGVALVQSSLLTLIAAATPTIPPDASWQEELTIRDGSAGAVSLAGMTMAISTFVAVFVVGSTFAFTVAQRRRDFALLRLVGAQPRQVRRLVRGEALTLATIGSGVGVALGVGASRLQASMFVRLGLVPHDFHAGWHWWILAPSFGIGLVVALGGAAGASRRAARVSPLDSLRATGLSDRVMTRTRWFVGLLAAAGTIALLASAPATGGKTALDTSVPACMVAVIALTALAPTVVPLVGRTSEHLTRAALPDGTLRELVHANLRDGVRRTTSTAAPIILLVGLVTGLVGSLDVITSGQLTEAEHTIDADLVATTNRPVLSSLTSIPQVLVASEETEVLVQTTQHLDDGSDEHISTEARVVDPAAYAGIHDLSGIRGNLDDLAGDAVALDPDLASMLHLDVGDTIDVSIDGTARELRVVALLPERLAGPELLLPYSAVATEGMERNVLLRLDEAANSDDVVSAVGELLEEPTSSRPEGTVEGFDDWIRVTTTERRGDSRDIITAILAMSTVYIVIAIINAVVIAAGDRREEFAVARLSGLTRTMVVRAAIAESLTVAGIGIALGILAAGTTLLGVTIAVSTIVGTPVIELPWSLLALTSGLVLTLTTITTALTAVAATRQPAISLAAARA